MRLHPRRPANNNNEALQDRDKNTNQTYRELRFELERLKLEQKINQQLTKILDKRLTKITENSSE